MGMIRIYQAKSKPAKKKKPGWRQEEAEYKAWLDRVNGTTLFNPNARPRTKPGKRIDPVVSAPVIDADRRNRLPSLGTFGGAGVKPVARPDILYRDDPELLARELAARAVKHNVAPAYNKGGDVYVTEDELVRQLSGNKRRS